MLDDLRLTKLSPSDNNPNGRQLYPTDVTYIELIHAMAVRKDFALKAFDFRNQMEAVRQRMADLIRSGMPRTDASERIQTEELSGTMAPDGLFMQRSIPGFYDEIVAEVGR